MYISWEKGDLPEDDYLFGLLEHNQQFFTEFLKDISKARKLNAHLSEDILYGWIAKLNSLELQIDAKDHISNILKIRSSLRMILEIVQKKESQVKDHALLVKIKEEMIAWNRKILSEEEYDRFSVELGKVKCLEDSIDTSDYDWTQFKQKLDEYTWRQEVRIKLQHQLSEEQIQNILRRAPRELKATKVYEWNAISEKAKEVEWMDDKRVTDRIKGFLDSMIADENMATIMKFINDSYISIISDATLDKLKVFERAVNYYRTKNIESVEKLEDLAKDMVDRKYYQTKTFEYFDKMLNTIRNLRSHVHEIEKTKEILASQSSQGLSVILEQACRIEKVAYTDILSLMNSLDQVPESLSSHLIINQEELMADINLFRQFRDETIAQTDRFSGMLSSVVNGDALSAIHREYKALLQKYYFTYALRDGTLEHHLRKIEVLIKACTLLESGWSIAESIADPIVNELDQVKEFEGVSPNLYKEIAFWESVLKDVKILYTGQDPQPLIVDELDSPLKEAKKLIQLIHKINIPNIPQEKRILTLEGLHQVINEKRESSEKIKMEDSIQYLQSIITKCQSIDQILAKERVDLEELRQAMVFMKSVSIQLGGQIKKCQERINRANQFLDKFNSLSRDKLESEFEQSTEEYNGLNLVIPSVEEVFNSVQECRNLKGEADRLLASDESTLEEMIDLKKRLSSMKYFKSTSITTSVLIKLFYKMREVYEKNDEDSDTTIDYADLCKLIGEAQNIIGHKGKNEIKAELKEKTGMVNQIFTDVTDHLKKHIYSLDLKTMREKHPDEVFRGFVNIKAPIEEHRKKVEAKEGTQKPTLLPTPSAPLEKPKVDHGKAGEGGGITQELRTYYMNNWRESLANNKSFNFDVKDTQHNAKRIERQIFEKYGKDVVEYERFCEEVSRLLKDFIFYTEISENLRTKKFCMSNLGFYLGKSAAEIRQVNYALSLDPNAAPSDLFKGDSKGGAQNQFQIGPSKEGTSAQAPPNETFENKVVYEEIKHKSMLMGDGKFYRVYQGDIGIQLKDNIKLELVSLVTSCNASIVSNFFQIPQKIVIPMNQPLNSFVTYINKVMNCSDGRYKLLHGYCSCSTSTERVNKLHQMMLEKYLVASRPYTDKFRVYIFPKEFLQKEWLENLEFLSLGKDSDLVFFLVFKSSEPYGENAENLMCAEPLVASGVRTYRLQLFNKSKDHQQGGQSIKEQKGPIINASGQVRIPPVAHVPPVSDPLAPAIPRKVPVEVPIHHEESFHRHHKSFNKSGSGYGLYSGGSSGITGAQMDSYHPGHFPEGQGKPSHRDYHYKNESDYRFSKKYTPPRPDWSQADDKFGIGEARLGPGYENDLLGALQNFTPHRNFVKHGMQGGHSHSHGHNYSHKLLSNTVSSGGMNNDISGYAQPSGNSHNNSKNSRMLTKRQPVVSNANSLISGSIGLKPHLGTSSLLAARETSPQSQQKSFLQTAINSIQVPVNPPTAVNSLAIADQRSTYHTSGKKNSSFSTYSKTTNQPSELRANLQAITEQPQIPSGDPYSKKKSGKGGHSGGQAASGIGGTKYQSSMPFDYVKNQHF